MSLPEHQYIDLLRDVIVYGDQREGRNGAVRSLFGRSLTFNLWTGFPLLTTKKVHFKSVAAELLWMLSGDTNVRALQAQNVTIWDEWADAQGDLGPVYGAQWRSWAAPNGDSIDQIANVIEGLKSDPYGRRHVVSAWNPADLDDMALPPCHCLFQFFLTTGGRLDCQVYQRSADLFLGVPFNIASYALLQTMVAQVVGARPGRLTHVFGDVHLYENHLQAAREQLRRGPLARPFPTMTTAKRASIDGWSLGDFHLSGYDPHPAIPAEVSK